MLPSALVGSEAAGRPAKEGAVGVAGAGMLWEGRWGAHRIHASEAPSGGRGWPETRLPASVVSKARPATSPSALCGLFVLLQQAPAANTYKRNALRQNRVRHHQAKHCDKGRDDLSAEGNFKG